MLRVAHRKAHKRVMRRGVELWCTGTQGPLGPLHNWVVVLDYVHGPGLGLTGQDSKGVPARRAGADATSLVLIACHCGVAFVGKQRY